MSTSHPIEVRDVAKRFRLYHERNQSLKASVMRGRRARYEEFWALDDVSFDVPDGTTFGLIGENGSGKSTMLKCMARILRPDRGSITTRGKISALLELGAGFHPELTGRENVYLNGAILGLSKKQLDARFDDIVEFAGIEPFIDTPVKNYSSGMYVRLGFSVAINVDPDVLLIDEVLAVGDAEFQRKCSEKIAEFRKQGKTIVIVSHSLPSVRTLCDEVALLEHGKLIEVGPPGPIIDHYLADAFSGSTDDAGHVRWGSGEVRVVDVQLLDASGSPIAKTHTGEQVTIRFHYEASETVIDGVLGMAVNTVGGAEVSGPERARRGPRVRPTLRSRVGRPAHPAVVAPPRGLHRRRRHLRLQLHAPLRSRATRPPLRRGSRYALRAERRCLTGWRVDRRLVATVGGGARGLSTRPVRRSILVVTGEVIAPEMAGPGIRAWHFAAALAAQHQVTLATTNRCDAAQVADGFRATHASPDELVHLAKQSEVVIVQGDALRRAPGLADGGAVMVVDLYDPFHLEQLEQSRPLEPKARRRAIGAALDVVNEQLRLGDVFLCASATQRDFWLGQLAGAGRVNERTYDDDPRLERLIVVVPFGIEAEPPVATGPALRGVVPGIDAADEIVLWGGGIYDWFDPDSLVEAIDALRRRRPRVRLVFAGARHPNRDIAVTPAARRVRDLAAERGLLDVHVFFGDWVPYDARAGHLLDADVAVSTHFDHVETAFSFRTRVLDYLWAGVPSVLTRGRRARRRGGTRGGRDHGRSGKSDGDRSGDRRVALRYRTSPASRCCGPTARRGLPMGHGARPAARAVRESGTEP